MKTSPKKDRFLEEVKAGLTNTFYRHLSLEAQAVIAEIESKIARSVLEIADLSDEPLELEDMPTAYLYAIPDDNPEMKKITDELLEAGFLKWGPRDGKKRIYRHDIDPKPLYEGLMTVLHSLNDNTRKH